MKLKVKDMDITTGDALVAIINEKDASKLDLHAMDRIKIKKGRKLETVVVNIAESSKAVPEGSIGLFEEVLDSLALKHRDYVNIKVARKPLSLDFIKKKLNGKTLTRKEIDQIVWDIVNNKLSNIELTYFVSACYTNAMSIKETVMLTKSIAEQGDVLELSGYPIVDKHCIGGIPGNRTTMLLVPIMAAAGFLMPKTSSRSITSPAGTADTMEVLANVCFTIKQMKKILQKTKGCIVWGGTLNLAPADEKIIKVERPLGIDAESQLVASVMAKKHSVRSTHILIDIPVGKEAKVTDYRSALILKGKFEHIGKKLSKNIKVIITKGTEPIGNGIGPALEARDVLWVLNRDKRRPLELEKKSLMMAALMLGSVGVKNSKKKAFEILDSGFAYERMKEIITEQGGNPEIKPEEIKLGRFRYDVVSGVRGTVRKLSCNAVSKIARVAGAPVDRGAGVYLYKHVGDKVNKGEKLFTIYTKNKYKLSYAREIAGKESAFILK